MTKGTCVASDHQLVVTVVKNQCLSQRKGLYRKRLQYYFWIERCFLLEGRILHCLCCHVVSVHLIQHVKKEAKGSWLVNVLTMVKECLKPYWVSKCFLGRLMAPHTPRWCYSQMSVCYHTVRAPLLEPHRNTLSSNSCICSPCSSFHLSVSFSLYYMPK